MLPLLLAFQLAPAASPMVENTRAHLRIERKSIPGDRIPTPYGEILLPPRARPNRPLPLVIHFHGAPWLAEQSIRHAMPHAAALAVQLGAGSRVYAQPFLEPSAFQSILNALNRPRGPIYLSGFSAGYGAIREILRQPENSPLITGVLLLDGIHAGYEQPEEQRHPLPADIEPYLEYARKAASRQTRFSILHSEIFPGSYASTTETTDWLLSQLGLRRKPVLRWGPLGMQILP
ncbi:MAG: hypothetical protein HZB13_05935 [Acidobacteria bacterium]|nr:hypothetical protein [Acidobacteriota bacterium]